VFARSIADMGAYVHLLEYNNIEVRKEAKSIPFAYFMTYLEKAESGSDVENIKSALWNRIYFLRFRFRFRLLKSYGTGSDSDF
jgi:hypothetical protein